MLMSMIWAKKGGNIADLLRRAAHVDVDDLGALVDVESGGVGHHHRIGARNLHRNGTRLATMLPPQARFARLAQLGSGGDHLGDRQASTVAAAQAAKWPIGHARHRSDEQSVTQCVRAKLHRLRWCGVCREGSEFYPVSLRKSIAVAFRKHRNGTLRGSQKVRRSCGAQKNGAPASMRPERSLLRCAPRHAARCRR